MKSLTRDGEEDVQNVRGRSDKDMAFRKCRNPVQDALCHISFDFDCYGYPDKTAASSGSCYWDFRWQLPEGITLGNIPAALVIAGGASGALFVIVSRMTEEAFGYGDSILITITGIFSGNMGSSGDAGTAFFLAAVFSGIMLSRKIYTRKSSFPFVPFLAAAYLGGVVIGAYG